MLYGPMMTRDHLLGMVAPGLTAICDEYRVQRARGAAWRTQIEGEIGFPKLASEFDRVQDVTGFPLACAIALVADNVARTYALVRLNNEKRRAEFGNSVAPGVTFGTALWVAANAARHYDDGALFADNEAVLNALGVTRRDEGVVLQVLEAACISEAATLLDNLGVLCDQIDGVAKARTP